MLDRLRSRRSVCGAAMTGIGRILFALWRRRRNVLGIREIILTLGIWIVAVSGRSADATKSDIAHGRPKQGEKRKKRTFP